MQAKAKAADLSYAEAGATRDSPLPADYRLDHYERQLSSNEGGFERAVGALRGWKAHVGAGVEIVPDDARVTVGEMVLFVIKTAGFWAVAPCRVVYVVDEPNQFSFAFGTLPGHPEQGEAAMIVERNEIGGVMQPPAASRVDLAEVGAAATISFAQACSRLIVVSGPLCLVQ